MNVFKVLNSKKVQWANRGVGVICLVWILLVQTTVIPRAQAQTRDQRDFNAVRGAATGAGLMGAAGAGACVALTAGGCGAVIAAGAMLGIIGGTISTMGTPDDFSLSPGDPSVMPDSSDDWGGYEGTATGATDGWSMPPFMLPW